MRKTSLFFYLLGLVAAIMSCQNKQQIDDQKPPIVDKYINDGWQLISSQKISENGDVISTNNFKPEGWYTTDIPSTVLAALVEEGEYKDIYLDSNFALIPKERFEKSWWYRKEFKADASYPNTDIIFEGINYQANVWLNGVLIGDAKTIEHPFTIFDLNITKHLKENNVLAIEVIPPAKDALRLGFVDWNPTAADQNMGLWRGVRLIQSGKVTLKNVVVKSQVDKEKHSWANLSIYADVINNSDKEVKGVLNYEIENIKVAKEYVLKPNQRKTIVASPGDFEQLKIQNPRLWWPINMGEPNLYTMKATAKCAGETTFQTKVRFGIREVGDFINEQGHRGYTVNGKKVLIRGGGWVDDVLLDDTDEKVKAQVQYVKHLGLNTIRLEGFWGKNKTIYNECDENGILLMIGLSCQWEWEPYCGRKEYDTFMSVETPEDIEMISKAYQTQVEWLNNHPSIYVWGMGSDKLPFPDFEKKLTKYINSVDGTRPLLTSCKAQVSEISGPSAVKMVGPYDYVTPNYWYNTEKYGGAYGYNTETGPGPQVPPMESMDRMLSKEHQWPVDNKVFKYHLGRHAFQSLDIYLASFDNRYGKAENIEDLSFRSQISSYETIRAMFEAFAVNKFNTTGVIQWMLNSAWPEMYWQLYDWYLMPNGAFYGTKAACQPLNLAYNYAEKQVYLTNEYLEAFAGKADIKILDINSKILFEKTFDVKVGENTVAKAFAMPELKGLTTTYFMDLKLKGKDGKEVSRNFYWLSTKEDVQQYEKSTWYHTPLTAYADLTSLNTMPKAKITVKHTFSGQNDNSQVEVKVKNDSDKIAFFIEMRIVGDKSNQSFLPVFWNDNYISLLPGEERTLSAKYDSNTLKGEKPKLKIKYLNQ